MELQNYSFVISRARRFQLACVAIAEPSFVVAFSCYTGGSGHAIAACTRFTAVSRRRITPMPDPVITRFAPSPTGFLHIGGARTALFNWLFARHANGKMLLRIEDTDRERSTSAAISAILDGLSWLGLDWDGDVIYQFRRAARHREVAENLLASGNAYYCYATPQELDEMREKARAEGRPPRYEWRWRDRPASEAPSGV